MNCRDSNLVRAVRNDYTELLEEYTNKYQSEDKRLIEFPLDESVMQKLDTIAIESPDEYYLFNHLDTIKELWKILIEKSIKCLRYFDTREPFMENSQKHPKAYGVNELQSYFEEYCKFESVLYGAGKYYRDHVIHVFRVWLLGIDCLLTKNGEYLNKIIISSNFKVNELEKISIWTMIAFTHDLGYPLEKAQSIIDTTKDMMKYFIQNPVLSLDLSFNGIQNNMNDFVLRFVSSKMVPKENNCLNAEKCECITDKNEYAARLQPKYYFKFQKSLEKYMHGIISSIIIYKLLLFFLESDFNINEDYYFKREDARQFYIRREILRAVASHTCKDIYHLKMETFSFLLIIADDSQDWGRKNISELYTHKEFKYEFGNITCNFDSENNYNCLIDETFTFENNANSEISRVLGNLKKQFDSYSSLFRNGQDTKNRDFTFSKQSTIEVKGNRKYKYIVEFTISNDKESSFNVTLQATDLSDHEYADEMMITVFREYINMIKKGDKFEISSDCKTEQNGSIQYTLYLNGKD